MSYHAQNDRGFKNIYCETIIGLFYTPEERVLLTIYTNRMNLYKIVQVMPAVHINNVRGFRVGRSQQNALWIVGCSLTYRASLSLRQ
jgi:hypothetical protein